MKKENEGYEGAPDGEGDKKDPKSRLDNLEGDVSELKSSVAKVVTILEKSVADKAKAEDEDDKKPDAEEDKDKKKEGEEEDKKPDSKDEEDKDKKKEVPPHEVSPAPDGGDVKLPKASAGETDEDTAPAGNKGTELVEKDISKMVDARVDSKLNDIMKSLGINKTQTPRTNHQTDIVKANAAKKTEFALDLLKRAKTGNLTAADMNRETKDFAKQAFERNIAAVINTEEDD